MRNFLVFISVLFILASCGGDEQGNTPSTNPVPEPMQPAPVVTILPVVNDVEFNTPSATLYNKVEMQVDLAATYQNPYDQREIALQATFTSPSNELYRVSGFWNGINQWLVRFTPSAVGNWQYSLQVTDSEGEGNEFTGNFSVETSNNSGWLQVGNQVNENYSARYLAFHDGTPFYGVGHADAFVNLFGRRASVDLLIENMREAKENYFVWWPQFDFSVVEDNFNDYNVNNLRVIDQVLEKIEQEQLFLIFTIWDHSQLRDASHPWAEGNWVNNNGFNLIVSADNFFINEEAWAWQQNLYRYIIARWGYSPAIAMWQTVSEINGTNAFAQTNFWHEKMNEYFQLNDPYQHPTTASMAGDLLWDEGHAVMDIAQVHVYQDLFVEDSEQVLTINTAKVMAEYTQYMWQLVEKPNWIGEFGIWNSATDNSQNYYPEVFHNAIWSALAAGAALSPAEWNDFFDWQVMTPEMKDHMRYFSDFVATTPLVIWDPQPIDMTSDTDNISTWGLLGNEGGLVWVQDTQLAGQSIVDIRAQNIMVENVSIHLQDVRTGQYQITPFDTWQGKFLASFSIDCRDVGEAGCVIPLPSFQRDIALRLNVLSR